MGKMDIAHLFIMPVLLPVLVSGFIYLHKTMRDVAAIQRTILLFMRQRFGDLEELLKP